MTILGAIVVAVVSGWVGTRIQARTTRRHWQREHGVTAWKDFIAGIHRWRSDLDTIEGLRVGELPSPKTLKQMRQTVWDISPDAPALYVFSPPAVNRPAAELLRLASDITDALIRGEPIPAAEIARFDQLKWEFVVVAAGEFGSQ